jgi:hypothetical protein
MSNRRTKKQKTVNALGFTTAPVTIESLSSKYMNKKIAMTDEVYAQRDRDDRVVGYHYVYQVCEVITASTRTGTQLNVCT